MNKYIPFVIPSTNLLEALYYYAGVVVYHGIYLMVRDKDD
jgi:hypothetical protein